MLSTSISQYFEASRVAQSETIPAIAETANSERWRAFDAIINAPATTHAEVSDKIGIALHELRHGNGKEALRLIDAARADLAELDDA